jgi:hypothetical protein
VAARLTDAERVILAGELGRGSQTLMDALQLRRAGKHFLLSASVDDVRAAVLRERSLEFCAAYQTWDEIRLLLDEGAGELAGARPVVDDADASALIEAIRLADGVIVGSWREHGRLLDALGIVPRETAIVIDPDPAVPGTVADERTDVVVYAPRERADALAAFVVTLADLEVPVTIVARDQPTIASRVQFVPPDGAAAALGRARVIVDASSNDPAGALALAALGRPLVVASSSGATEVLRGAGSYDLWNRRSLLAAVANALGGRAPQIRTGAFDRRPPPRTAPAFAPDAPLVSVIVTTYRRRTFFARASARSARKRGTRRGAQSRSRRRTRYLCDALR